MFVTCLAFIEHYAHTCGHTLRCKSMHLYELRECVRVAFLSHNLATKHINESNSD